MSIFFRQNKGYRKNKAEQMKQPEFRGATLNPITSKTNDWKAQP